MTPRLFIALPIPEDIVSRLASVAATEAEGWRRMRPESLHLTLVFLGSVEERLVGNAQRAMRVACVGVPPLALSVEGSGAFPSEARAKVVWAGVSGDLVRLHSLHDRLERELRNEGFDLEDRQYRPHVTLARSRVPRGMPPELNTARQFGRWEANEVVLYESRLGGPAPRYIVKSQVLLRQT